MALSGTRARKFRKLRLDELEAATGRVVATPVAAAHDPITDWRVSSKMRVTDAHIDRAADKMGLPFPDGPLIVRAVNRVETGGRKPWDRWDRIVILYEPHKFGSLTNHRFTGKAQYATLSARKWGEVPYGSAGTAWRRLEAAYKLAPEEALQASSWGPWQIMGFNHRA